MTDPPLRYVDTTVTQQEVPDEISLTITISGCQYRCPGCHSPYLQEDKGIALLPRLDALIEPYQGLITCVCLMGEGQNRSEQADTLRQIRRHALKTCLYSGSESIESFAKLLPLLDYQKIGSYRKEAGGLDSPATNQRFYRIDGETHTDITAQFHSRKEIL